MIKMLRHSELKTKRARNISKALKERFKDKTKHPMYGKKRSPETIAKMTGCFKKGCTSWIKGKKQSLEHVKKKAMSKRIYQKWTPKIFDIGIFKALAIS